MNLFLFAFSYIIKYSIRKNEGSSYTKRMIMKIIIILEFWFFLQNLLKN